MSNEIIFYTQITSIVVFVLAVFGIYRLLVEQKDSVIQLLKERIEAQVKKIQELESLTPDALASALSSRIEMALVEIERLREDRSMHKVEIEKKEDELKSLKARLDDLSSLIRDSNLACPECGSPLSIRDFYPISERGIETDEEYIEYECGLSLRGGRPVSPCRHTKP